MQRQSGNALFLILVAAALFAALSYVVTKSNRSGAGSVSSEKNRLETARVENQVTAINTGLMRLSFVPCNDVDFTPPGSWGAGPHRCSLYHPDGGGVPYSPLPEGYCENGRAWSSLAIGESCEGVTYAGAAGSKRIYTNGAVFLRSVSNPPYVALGNTSNSDGKGNTETMLASPKQQALVAPCRAFGEEWYLPARDEMAVIAANASRIPGFNGTREYWTSTEATASTQAWYRFNGTALVPSTPATKNGAKNTICIRSD